MTGSDQSMGRTVETQISGNALKFRFLALLATLMGFASISTDLYLPAMPVMGKELQADTGTMELTITGFLIGFSVGQLFWGPLGDRFGRRLPIALGILLFVVGSIGCGLSASPTQIMVWRIVQAAGACSGVVLARAMVRDVYTGAEAARMLSTLLTVMAVAPLLGPFLGAYILEHFGWRMIFFVLAAIGAITIAALFSVPETLPADKRLSGSLSAVFRSYGQIISDFKFLSFSISAGFFYLGVYAYVAGTPFAFIQYYGVDPKHYGVLFALGVVGIIVTNTINRRLLRHFNHVTLLLCGAAGAATIGIATAAIEVLGYGQLWLLVVLLFLFISFSGLILANSMTGAMQDFPQRAGAASALAGAIQYGFGIFGSAAIGFLANGTPGPLAVVICVSGLGCLTFSLCSFLITARHRH
ncbi:multidrug effflux MFS transporter [Rhizobium sp. CFBP 8762]|uniref:multidrug effflux MFS transporter n=1 Tax=Rhizobium sp. CFBP 8762 TaxID=2775279 RepID=UPI00313DDE9C